MESYRRQPLTCAKVAYSSLADIDRSTEHWTLSKWLAVKTYDARSRLVASISSLDLSLSRDDCVRLANAHESFRHSVRPAYGDPILQSILHVFFSNYPAPTNNRQEVDRLLVHAPGLTGRCALPKGLIPRMGWLYASEFVDLGLAKLARKAQFYRGLSIEYDERHAMWQQFKTGLDGVRLSEVDEEILANGACAALHFYAKQLHD